MSTELLAQISNGESETLELKTSLRDPYTLARLIGAFANTSGGVIVAGVQEPDHFVGIDIPATERAYNQACTRLNPQPKTSLSFPLLEGTQVAVITVEKSPTIVFSDNGAHVRKGSNTVAMSAIEISQHLESEKGTVSDDISTPQAIERLTKRIDDLTQEIQIANGSRWKERLFGFWFGLLASAVVAVGQWLLSRPS